MADDKNPKPVAPQPTKPTTNGDFRRQCATAILTGFVSRQGGLGTGEEREANARMIWSFADAMVEFENAGPWVSPAERELAELNKEAAREKAERGPQAPVHPSDEWAVKLGGRMKRGFVIKAEADAYAFQHPGAIVVQLAGPGVEAGRMVADPSVMA